MQKTNKKFCTKHLQAGLDWPNSLHYNNHLDEECDLTQKLPFPDSRFDTILLSDVLEHIPSPEDLWREMHRVLVINGVLILNVPFYYRIHEEPHDYYRYTEYALRRFAENTGFYVELIEPIGGALESLTDITAKCVANVPLVGAWAARFAQWAVFSFSATRPGIKALKGSGKKYPLGYVLVARKRLR